MKVEAVALQFWRQGRRSKGRGQRAYFQSNQHTVHFVLLLVLVLVLVLERPITMTSTALLSTSTETDARLHLINVALAPCALRN